MDITVDEVEGLPANTYVSIRCGDSRKQAPFRPGEILSFPNAAPGGSAERLPKAYTVDVYRKVGSKQVSLAGITALGGKIKHEGLVIPSFDIQGAPVTTSLTASVISKATPDIEGSKKAMVAQRAKQYLEKHGIQTILHEMFAALIERLPGDPLAFLVDYLEQQQEEAEGRLAIEHRDFSFEPGLGPGALPGFADGDPLPDLSQHHSILVDVLRKDPGIVARMEGKKTSLGVTLAQCMKAGIDCPGHELVKVGGTFAGDEESYELFRDLFDPVIGALHAGWDPSVIHPKEEKSTGPSKLTNARIDPTGKYAVFASMETRRNMKGLRLPTWCSLEERREVERTLVRALDGEPDLNGTYYPLRESPSYEKVPGGMTQHQEERLRGVGMLFAEPDSRMRLSAGLGRHWPDARGIFVAETQGLYVWANEEDHLRFFSRQHTVVDLKKLWQRLQKTMQTIERGAEKESHGFARSERLGYITTDPSRLGAALRISVSLQVPLLAAATDLSALCRSLDLQSSQEVGVAGSPSLWNISSTDCLGVSEIDLINMMITGCATMVELEQRLERGEPIYDAMPGLGAEPYPGFPSDRCPSKMPDLASSHNLMAAVLTESPPIYDLLRNRKTAQGVALAPCMKPGVDDRGHPRAVSIGLVAGDQASYTAFQELFDPVIARLHKGFDLATKHPSEFSTLNPAKIRAVDIDPTGEKIVSVRVDLRRNLQGVLLAPCCGKKERREVEGLLAKGMQAMATTNAGCTGEYLPLASSQSYAQRMGGMAFAEEAQLFDRQLCFAAPNVPARLAAGLGRDWPDARGCFLGKGAMGLGQEQDWAIWCNEEDHLRFIALRAGGDLLGAFGRVFDCVTKFEAELQRNGLSYMHDARLGYLTVDPTHLGSGLRCTVTLRLPRLSVRPEFSETCQALGLQASWRAGTWEVYNGPSLGLSEADLISKVAAGCQRLVHLETQLELGKSLDAELKELNVLASKN